MRLFGSRLPSTRLLLAVLVASAAGIAVTAGIAAADVEGEPVLDVTLADNRVTPGEATTIELRISNEGRIYEADPPDPSLRNRVTTARGLTVRTTAGSAPIEVRTGPRSIGSLPEGVSSPVPFDIIVDEDAEPGVYRIPVSTTYTYTRVIDDDDGTETTQTRSRSFQVRLEVEKDAQLAVRDVSTDARVGSGGTVTVTVENTGSMTASEAALEVTSPNADLTFAGSSTASRSIGEWEPGERRTIEYTVTPSENAESQPYTLDVVATYRDDDGVQRRSKTRSVAVVPGPEESFAVGNVSSTLSVGAEGDLRGTVTNTGDAEVTNAVVRFVSESATVTALETEAPVGTLAPGESAEFSIPLEISESAEPGPRQYEVSVRYRGGDGDLRESDTFDVQPEVGPDDPEFSLSADGATVQPGAQTRIRVTITNEGDQRLTDISANVFADDPISAVDDEAFVSSLDPGESATMTFSVSAAGGALANDYPLSIDFEYDEPDGDTLISDTYKVPVTVERVDDDGGLPVVPVLVAGGVLVVVAGLAYSRYR